MYTSKYRIHSKCYFSKEIKGRVFFDLKKNVHEVMRISNLSAKNRKTAEIFFLSMEFSPNQDNSILF